LLQDTKKIIAIINNLFRIQQNYENKKTPHSGGVS